MLQTFVRRSLVGLGRVALGGSLLFSLDFCGKFDFQKQGHAGASSTEGGHGGAATGGATDSGGSDVTAMGGESAAAGASGAGDSSAGGEATQGGAESSGGSSAGGSVAGGASSGGASAKGGATSKGGSSAGGATSTAGGSAGASGLKVMPLGDSITASTCYPQVLSQNFKTGGHTNFRFVGTQITNQACAGAPSVPTEGHGGYGVTYLPANSTRAACTKSTGCGSYAELQTWAAEKPDIVLMHYGTNDVWDGQPIADILSAYLAVVAEFRLQNPNVVFFISKIIKLNPAGCANCLTNVAALAAALTDTWASENSTDTSAIYVVDDYDSGFDPTTDSADGVHPNLAGATKMATATYDGVVAQDLF